MKYIKEYNSSKKPNGTPVPKPNWTIDDVISSYKMSLYKVCRYFYDSVSPTLDTINTDEIKIGCFYDSDDNTLDVMSVLDSECHQLHLGIKFEHSIPLFIPGSDFDITMIVSSEDCLLYAETSNDHVFSYSMDQNEFVDGE